MRRPRLYCPELRKGPLRLSAEESNHACASLRLRTGDVVETFNGKGLSGSGKLVTADRESAIVDIAELTTKPFDLFHRITLAVAMGRTHRQGYLIEKCTELGVAAVLPIIAERSVSKPDAGSVEKWTRRSIEACKQSGRYWTPIVEAPVSIDALWPHLRQFDITCLVQPSTETANETQQPQFQPNPPFDQLLRQLSKSNSILVMVGPEGGWSDFELQVASDAGVRFATLGPTVLRTETAAIAVCAAAALDHAHRRIR